MMTVVWLFGGFGERFEVLYEWWSLEWIVLFVVEEKRVGSRAEGGLLYIYCPLGHSLIIHFSRGLTWSPVHLQPVRLLLLAASCGVCAVFCTPPWAFCAYFSGVERGVRSRLRPKGGTDGVKLTTCSKTALIIRGRPGDTICARVQG